MQARDQTQLEIQQQLQDEKSEASKIHNFYQQVFMNGIKQEMDLTEKEYV